MLLIKPIDINLTYVIGFYLRKQTGQNFDLKINDEFPKVGFHYIFTVDVLRNDISGCEFPA